MYPITIGHRPGVGRHPNFLTELEPVPPYLQSFSAQRFMFALSPPP